MSKENDTKQTDCCENPEDIDGVYAVVTYEFLEKLMNHPLILKFYEDNKA